MPSSMALETAEGFAELIHRQMRDRWGFPDPIDFTMRDRFAAKYQGQRILIWLSCLSKSRRSRKTI